MPALTHPLPDVTTTDAAEILAEHWGIRGTIRPLPGEREWNFHVYTGDASEFVLKIASPLEDAAAIDLQIAALVHLAARAPEARTPAIVPSPTRSRVVHHTIRGETHSARLLTWLPGKPLAEVSPHGPELLQAIGRWSGSITAALTDFEHPAARRSLKWDLATAGWIAEHVDRISDGVRRAQVRDIIGEYTGTVQPRLAATRSSVVHNDGNDWNLLVGRNSEGALAPSGIIDFGDLLESHPV